MRKLSIDLMHVLVHVQVRTPNDRRIDMRLGGIDLNLLVVLAAVLQEQGVTAAARRLGLSQSATSHALARLREQLDDPILLRTARGMVPTARARAMLPTVLRILEDTESVFLGVTGFEPALSDETFRIALDESAQRTLLPPLIARLQERAPRLQLIVRPGLRSENMLASFERGEVDLAISSHLPADERDLHSEFLLSAPYVTISRAGHPTIGKRLSLKRFVEVGHVAVTHPNLADIAIDLALSVESLSRRVIVTVPEPAEVPALVARTDLVATLPERLLEMGDAPTTLVRHRPPIPLDPVPVYAIHHERNARSPALLWLREQIDALVGDIEGR